MYACGVRLFRGYCIAMTAGFRMSRDSRLGRRGYGYEQRPQPDAVAGPGAAGRDGGSGRTMSLVSTDPVVVHAIDDMLRLVSLTRRAKVRDPLRALEDTLLEMRQAVAGNEIQAGLGS